MSDVAAGTAFRCCCLAFLLGCGAPDEAALTVLPKFTIREDLRITSPDSGTAVPFTTINQLAVFDDGTVVATARGEEQLWMFEASGKFRRMIGRPGDGPGEFRAISAMGRINDEIWAADVRHASAIVFGKDGLHRRTIVFPSALYREGWRLTGFLLHDRFLMTREFMVRTTQRAGYIQETPPHDGVVSTLATRDSTMYAESDSAASQPVVQFTWRHTIPRRVEVRWNKDRLSLFPQLFEPRSLALSTSDGGSIIFIDAALVQSSPGEIRVMSGAGNRGRTYHVSLAPRPLSSAFADSAVHKIISAFATGFYEPGPVDAPVIAPLERASRSGLHVPSHLPELGQIIAAGPGDFWIHDRYTDGMWTIVRNEKPVATIRVPSGLELVALTRDHVWGVKKDADDVPVIVRFLVETAR